MNAPDPRTRPALDALTGDLAALVRRHDPEWTGFNSPDPGMTLLEVGAWLAERLGVTAGRYDPYPSFKFRVKWDRRVVAGVSRVSALRRTAEIVEHREGGAPDVVLRTPGRVVYSPFVLERPLGEDTAFEDWADLVGDGATGAAPSTPGSHRKDLRLEILDHRGQLFLAYDVHGCWPAGYRVLPDLTESLTLVPERWHRDRRARAPSS